MMRQEEQLLEAFWSNEEQERKLLPRRDVTKSRRGGQLLQKSTIPHVATSSRRDVSSKFWISSLNARGLGNLGYRRVCGQRHDFGGPATLTGRFFLDFCIRFSLFAWLFLDYRMVFFILYILFLSLMMF